MRRCGHRVLKLVTVESEMSVLRSVLEHVLVCAGERCQLELVRARPNKPTVMGFSMMHDLAEPHRSLRSQELELLLDHDVCVALQVLKLTSEPQPVSSI